MGWTVAIGVDTHKDVHVAVACDQLGAQLDACEVDPSAGGYARLLEWAEGLGRPAFAIEGCGSYGAGLARFLEAAGLEVCGRASDRAGASIGVVRATYSTPPAPRDGCSRAKA